MSTGWSCELEGASSIDVAGIRRTRPVGRWRGRDRSRAATKPRGAAYEASEASGHTEWDHLGRVFCAYDRSGTMGPVRHAAAPLGPTQERCRPLGVTPSAAPRASDDGRRGRYPIIGRRRSPWLLGPCDRIRGRSEVGFAHSRFGRPFFPLVRGQAYRVVVSLFGSLRLVHHTHPPRAPIRTGSGTFAHPGRASP
jgi:hypothetical protein